MMRNACYLGLLLLVYACGVGTVAAGPGHERPILLRAGAPSTAGYAFAIELAQVLGGAPKDRLLLRVEASEGEGESAAEIAHKRNSGIFVATAGAVGHAPDRRSGSGKTPGIRALFPLPFLAMHWVVRADSGITTLAGLGGRRFVPGTGLSAIETADALAIVHLAKPIDSIASADGLSALAGTRAVGFAAAAAYPEPRIAALARRTKIRLLGLAKQDLAKLLARDRDIVAAVIPAGTYPGMSSDLTTIGIPLGVYATAQTSEAEAYRITRAFWQSRRALAAHDPRWAAVAPEEIFALGAPPAAGALSYYGKARFPVLPGRR